MAFSITEAIMTIGENWWLPSRQAWNCLPCKANHSCSSLALGHCIKDAQLFCPMADVWHIGKMPADDTLVYEDNAPEDFLIIDRSAAISHYFLNCSQADAAQLGAHHSVSRTYLNGPLV
jgi:hypothetical protein